MQGKMTFDYSKLRGRIVERYGTLTQFGKAMHISQPVLSSRMTGSTYFTQSEILRAIALLDIEPESISPYFFTVKV